MHGVLQLPFEHPGEQVGLGLGGAGEVVEDEEPLHAGPSGDQGEVVLEPVGLRPVVVVRGDGAAAHHAGLEGELTEADVEDLAAHVVEVDVDPVGAQLAQPGRHVLGAVVHGRVEAQLLHQPRALLVRAGDAHHPAGFLDPGDLAHHRSRGPGRTRHHDGVARVGLTHVEQPEVRGHAGHPEHAQGRGGVDAGRHHLGGLVGVVEHHVVLPADHGEDDVAHRIAVGVRRDHPGETTGAHHLADADRWEVPGGVVHPRADGGVDRHVGDPGHGLTRPRFGHRAGLEADGGVVGHAGGAVVQDEATALIGHGRHPRTGGAVSRP